MKKLFYIILLLCLPGMVWAQDQSRFERIRALKTSFITDRLQFTPEQSARFWPVYNQYEAEARGLRKSYKSKYRAQNAKATRVEAQQYIEDNIEYQEQLLTLKKNYRDKLLKTITPQQLAKLYEAERDFKKLLIEQLKD